MHSKHARYELPKTSQQDYGKGRRRSSPWVVATVLLLVTAGCAAALLHWNNRAKTTLAASLPRTQGLYISLRDALDPATPLYQEELRPLQLSEAPQPDRVVHAPGNSLQDGSLSELHPGSAAGHGGESGATPAGHTPFQAGEAASTDSEPRFFVAVMSACCTTRGWELRQGARRSWVRHLREHFPTIPVKFMLGQPPAEQAETLNMTLLLHQLEEEAREAGDLVFVRAEERYSNLPDKVLQVMRFVASGRGGRKATHLLKTDDDCYVRMQNVLAAITDYSKDPPTPRSQRLYLGCVENPHGYWPIRDPHSKWYVPRSILAEGAPPSGVRYVAGWCYAVSRDVLLHVLRAAQAYERQPELQPPWYSALQWEDVRVGAIAAEYAQAEDSGAWRAAWRSCTADTAVRHLDVDAPAMFEALYVQENIGLWSKKTVQCSFGDFAVGNYQSWKAWRANVASADPV